MPKLTLDGADIEYLEAGTGLPLVFCHEFAGSLESWEAQISYFSRFYRVFAYNAKGYPPSEVRADWREYTWDRQVAVLLGLLDAMDIGRAHICGLSMGAYTAVQFALAHPGRCHGVVAAGVGTGSDDPDAFLEDMDARADALEKLGMASMEAYVRGPARIRFREKDPTGWERFAALFLAHSAQGSANTLRAFQGRRPALYTREADLAALEVPLLVVCGDEDDPCINPSLFLKRTVPGCGLAVLPHTGHACNLEEPAAFNAVVAEFLARVEAGRWGPRPEDSSDNIGAVRPGSERARP